MLRLLLVAANSMAGENSIYIWSRDHRTHHKYSETSADPHNAKVKWKLVSSDCIIANKIFIIFYQRGFFFSHIGWLCVRKHPRVISAGKTINMEDLESDTMVMFQHRHYLPCFLLFSFIIPSAVPLLWSESLISAYFISVLRYVMVLHFTWLVNSAAHM